MKIKNIISQNRRDFSAILECEHCGHEERMTDGYDDDNFHRNVVPNIKCQRCRKPAPENYRPLATKYGEHEVV